MKIKNIILFIILGFMIAFLLLLSTEVKASNYDLSDYKNHITNGYNWFLLHTLNDDNYYFLTTLNTNRYFMFRDYTFSNGTYYLEGAFSTVAYKHFQVYKFNKSTNKFDYFAEYNVSQYAYDKPSLGRGEVLASSANIYQWDATTVFVPPFEYSPSVILPTLEWSFDRRVNTVIMNSQHFTLGEITKYNLYYTTNSSEVEDYKNLPYANIGSLKDTSTDTTSYFWFLSFENYFVSNATYYFILEDIETGEVAMSSMKINFDSLNEYFDEQLNQNLEDSGFTTGTSFTNGVPSLQMKYTRYMNADSTYYYQISSQYFSQYEVTDQYVAYYTNDTSILEDYSSWNTLNIATFKDTKTGQTNYYYFFNMPSDSENTTYYFVLYNKITGQYGSVSSLTLDFNSMWEYSEQLKNDNNVVNSRFDKLIEYIKERFGFILYPFELIGDIFNRFYNINWEEPIIKIPALNVPVFGQVLTEEFTYNFNDLLDNTTIKYIHTIYLVFADVILIFAVIQFGMKVFEEVFVNG